MEKPKWIPYSARYGLILLVSLLLTACATTPEPLRIRSDVDALAISDAQSKRRFVILPGDKALKAQDLQFIEFKNYVEKVLAKRGFIKADSLQDGDVVLFLNYGVGEPQAFQTSYDVPVWSGWGYYPYYRRYRFYPAMSPYYTQRIETYMLYKRYLSLEAYDMAAYLQQKTPRQLWKVTVQSRGTSNDLRLTLPYMLAAMEPYVGTNTGHMVTVDVDEFNPALQNLLSNPSQSPALAAPQQQKK